MTEVNQLIDIKYIKWIFVFQESHLQLSKSKKQIIYINEIKIQTDNA